MFTLPSATKIIKSVSKVSGKKREIRDQADRIKVFFPAYEINYLRYFCVDLDSVVRTRGWGLFFRVHALTSSFENTDKTLKTL